MLIGYARTSTLHQQAGFEQQIEKLKKEGCEKIYSEQVSSIYDREELNKAIEFARAGDVFIVTKIDRLARSLSHLMKIIETLEKKEVQLKILDFGLDTNTATGKMMLQVLGAVAEFERVMMLERQRVGIEKAKKAGKFRGRVTPIEKIKKLEEKIRSYDRNSQESLSIKEIAQLCGVSTTTVYKKIREIAPNKIQKKATKATMIKEVFLGNEKKYQEVNFYQDVKRKRTNAKSQ